MMLLSRQRHRQEAKDGGQYRRGGGAHQARAGGGAGARARGGGVGAGVCALFWAVAKSLVATVTFTWRLLNGV